MLLSFFSYQNYANAPLLVPTPTSQLTITAAGRAYIVDYTVHQNRRTLYVVIVLVTQRILIQLQV